MKNLLKMLPILLVMLFVSCKKEDATPTPDLAKDIATSELLDYYIVAEFKTGFNRLMTMHFTKEGNTIKVHGHVQQGYQAKEIVVKNNAFTVDYFGDGKSIYTFMIEKDEAGKLKLKSYSFSFNGLENELDYALLISKPGRGIIGYSKYKMIERSVPISNIENGLVIMMSDTVYWTLNAPSVTLYTYMDIGYKSNNGKYMLVSVPHWKGINIPIILIEFDNSLLIAKHVGI